jgi:hypothetical protein
MNPKQVKEKLVGIFDRVSVKKDGTYNARRDYFYRHGSTAQGFGEAVMKVIPGAVLIKAEDNWKAWPKQSFFHVTFRVNEEAV